MHDNARPCVVNVTKQLLDPLDQTFRITHSPDLAPSDYHLFISFKMHMGGKTFSVDDEVKGEVNKWEKELAGDFFAKKIAQDMSPHHPHRLHNKPIGSVDKHVDYWDLNLYQSALTSIHV